MADTGKGAAEKITVSMREGIVWVELRGDITFQDSVNAMRAASAAAHEHAADRLAFDLRASRHAEFHAMTLESAALVRAVDGFGVVALAGGLEARGANRVRADVHQAS